MSNKIKNAVIIHGPGRSGTTLLSNILSLSNEFYWISGYVNRFPRFPFLSFLNRLISNSKIEKWTRNKRFFPRPSEAYGFWKHYFQNFDGVKEYEKEPVKRNDCIRSLNRIKLFTGKKRFITKLTGMSRSNVLDVLFESPKVIWIDRKPEAVIMSYYKQRWKYKRSLKEFNSKNKMQLIKEYSELYNDFYLDKKKLKKYDFKQVYYEDLISDPIGFFKDICAFLEIEFSQKFIDLIKNWEIYKGSNDSFKKLLEENEINFLSKLTKQYNKELGYKE